MQRGDYDYNHATLGTQTLVIVLLICVLGLGGLALGLTLLTSIL